MNILSARSVSGTIVLPGDKSISHRAAMLSAIADGTSNIHNFAASEDCSSTLDCLSALGVNIELIGTVVLVHGVGLGGLKEPTNPLDCGNSGTTMRLISGILAGQPFSSTLIGDESLSKRPMKRVIGPLSEMGASIESVDGHAPLIINGRGALRPIEYTLPVASAQIKSCVLLAGLWADGETSVIEPVPTRDHTERMLRGFGVDVTERDLDKGKRVSVSGGSRLTACDMTVPSDISSAAFFVVAAACRNGSRIVMPNVGINPTRTGLFEVLRRLGADTALSDKREQAGELVATVEVVGRGLGAVAQAEAIIDGPVVANMIDEVPILAVFGTQIESGLEIRGAGELRVKESDRIHSIVENLRRMNANVTEYDDGFRVERSHLKGAEIDSFGDHRIAMAFTIAGLLATGETTILGAESAAVSFPDFFETLQSVTVR